MPEHDEYETNNWCLIDVVPFPKKGIYRLLFGKTEIHQAEFMVIDDRSCHQTTGSCAQADESVAPRISETCFTSSLRKSPKKNHKSKF